MLEVKRLAVAVVVLLVVVIAAVVSRAKTRWNASKKDKNVRLAVDKLIRELDCVKSSGLNVLNMQTTSALSDAVRSSVAPLVAQSDKLIKILKYSNAPVAAIYEGMAFGDRSLYDARDSYASLGKTLSQSQETKNLGAALTRLSACYAGVIRAVHGLGENI